MEVVNMEFCVFLNFNGNCRDALNYYAGIFGVEILDVLTYGDMEPADEAAASFLPDHVKNYIAYSELHIFGNRLCFSDIPPEECLAVGNNVCIAVMSQDPDEIMKLYDKLKVGATIQMELAETVWSKGYAELTDKFGIHWKLNLCCQ
ncbi:VOC family protein [Methanolapillus ohkumae]|uniref:Glyoxalase/fosfomycin resistance/dioxygenase domain-containing protein n=1 Tax=Methanolapillus ohkumae TaxID=3028298 RepID=A0AA96ZVB7_9EURY|nr:hypothetical protein MsAm2_03210 [Methanosarcinaceae archaeon Am2]